MKIHVKLNHSYPNHLLLKFIPIHDGIMTLANPKHSEWIRDQYTIDAN